MMIDVYTDGACSGNPGRGGWAAVIVDGGGKRSLHGSEERTTNNRMEMLAVIKGLEAVPESASVTVNSDSEYVINTMTRNWRRNANKDLWARLDAAAAARRVRWNKVPAHSGVALNEEADGLAAREAGSRAFAAKSRRSSGPARPGGSKRAARVCEGSHARRRLRGGPHGGRRLQGYDPPGGRGEGLRCHERRDPRPDSGATAPRRATCSAWPASRA